MSRSELKKLQKEWYKKLEDTGFNDIEKNESSEYNVKRPVSKRFTEKNKLFRKGTWVVKQEYYDMALEFLNVYPFPRELDKVIWEYHANGLTVRDISQTLLKTGITLNPTGAVARRIKKYSDIMKKVLWTANADTTNEQ